MAWTVKTLRSVFQELRSSHEYATDRQVWGLPDHWESPDQINLKAIRLEDCDGFALAVRKRLRELDIPNRLVLCEVPNQGYHLVCEVKGYIFDNRYLRLRSRDKMNYKWLAISGYEAGEPWRALEDYPVTVAYKPR